MKVASTSFTELKARGDIAAAKAASLIEDFLSLRAMTKAIPVEHDSLKLPLDESTLLWRARRIG